MNRIKPLRIVTLLTFLCCLATCDGCPPEREIEYSPCRVTLNLQICQPFDTLRVAGINYIRWQGTLERAVDGAVPGRNSFDWAATLRQFPTRATPSGNSWFERTEDNLTAGYWRIEVQYEISDGLNSFTDHLDIHSNGGVYYTQGIRELPFSATTAFPACP